MSGDSVFSVNAMKILKNRYLWQKSDGTQETPNEMFKRVARTIASAEKTSEKVEEMYGAFYEMMSSLRFLPNTPTLTNAGRPNGLLAACLVLPLEDSMEGIMDCIKAQAMCQKHGAGTGMDFGIIRERGAPIKSTGMTAVGPIPIIRLMNFMMSEFIIQGGVRHGANLAALPCDHPDVLEFVSFKEKEECKSFNVSVTITNAFMKAVENNEDWNLVSRYGGNVVKRISANLLFNEIVKSAWKTGDPGVLFIDTINEANPTPHLGKIATTNPCGESDLLPYEACTLGHLNLTKYLTNGVIDWNLFKHDIHLGVRFLDNVIDVTHYPLPEIEQMHRHTNRKIGLGIMGFADLLARMGIPYSSGEAIDTAHTIGSFLKEQADEASSALGRERGSFQAFKESVVSNHFDAMRNATRLTIAPTGTTSIIAGCSAGIEPNFALLLQRNQINAEMYEIYQPFKEWLGKSDKINRIAILQHVSDRGSLLNCKDVPENIQQIFLQANEIGWEQHIRLQATWQRYIDLSISKTINMPQDSTMEDIKQVYITAWKLGCKGVTIFRDHCKGEQVLSSIVTNSSSRKQVRTCPECGSVIVNSGGCMTCNNCGYSACSI